MVFAIFRLFWLRSGLCSSYKNLSNRTSVLIYDTRNSAILVRRKSEEEEEKYCNENL